MTHCDVSKYNNSTKCLTYHQVEHSTAVCCHLRRSTDVYSTTTTKDQSKKIRIPFGFQIRCCIHFPSHHHHHHHHHHLSSIHMHNSLSYCTFHFPLSTFYFLLSTFHFPLSTFYFLIGSTVTNKVTASTLSWSCPPFSNSVVTALLVTLPLLHS